MHEYCFRALSLRICLKLNINNSGTQLQVAIQKPSRQSGTHKIFLTRVGMVETFVKKPKKIYIYFVFSSPCSPKMQCCLNGFEATIQYTSKALKKGTEKRTFQSRVSRKWRARRTTQGGLKQSNGKTQFVLFGRMQFVLKVCSMHEVVVCSTWFSLFYQKTVG